MLLVGFAAYLRPRELSSLVVLQLVPPQIHGGRHFRFWSLLMSPEEQLIRSKGGRFDDSIPIDNNYFLPAGQFFQALTANRSMTDRLWPFSHQQLISAFKRAAMRTGVDVPQPALYVLRHSGASHAALGGFRAVPAI